MKPPVRRCRELLWIAPFLGIALIAAGLLRPQPRLPLPAHARTVVDAGGTPVPIAQPFRGIALAAYPNGYLENTRSPGLLVYAGKPSDRKRFATEMMSWVYPEVVKNDALWNAHLFQETDSPFSEIETLLAYAPSVYLGCGGPPDVVRRVGLPVYNCGGYGVTFALRRPELRAKVGCGSPTDPLQRLYPRHYVKEGGYYSESYLFPAIRSLTVLTGKADEAEPRIDAYCQSVADLQQELQPAAIAHRLHVSALGEDRGNLPRAGVTDAEWDFDARGDDGERLLYLDPDIIFITGLNASPREFMSDPRRQGLKAVAERRVYKRFGGGIVTKPVAMRWIAEIAYPERLKPGVRQLLRDRMFEAFHYRLSDDQIDELLNVKQNSSSAGAERFTRGYQSADAKGATQ
ncbi:MAG: hypothetical protein P4M01_06245 [Acidobacteriota bacterium]|nr:hypothetical protein [Acidobacteriota bacterium]